MIAIAIVCLVVPFLAIAAFKVIRFFSYWKDRNVPQYDVWTIISRTAIDLFNGNSIGDGHRAMYNDFQNTRYYGGYELLAPTLFLKDLELIRQFTLKDFRFFEDHTEFIPVDGDPIAENILFSLKGEKWRRVRAAVSPIFTSSKMKAIFNVVCDGSKQLLDYIKEINTDTKDFEMRDLLGRLTNDVIVSTVFGVECNSLKNPNNEFFMTAKEVTQFSGFLIHLKYILMKVVPKFCKLVNMRILSTKIADFYKRVVLETMALRNSYSNKRTDLIKLLMEAQKNQEQVQDKDITEFRIENGDNHTYKHTKPQMFTPETTAGLVINFHGAGYDSVVTLLSFMAYELALNQEAQHKLRNEIDDVYETLDGNPTYEVIMKMKYLDMCICETLRKWPGGIFVERCCTRPYTIQPISPQEKPVNIDAGVRVYVTQFGLHHDPKYYPNPDKFDPERFSDKNRPNINPYAYLPFGIGPRFCIGNRYALLQAKVLFFYLLREYTLSPTSKTRIPLRISRKYFQLRSKDGIWLRFIKRKF